MDVTGLIIDGRGIDSFRAFLRSEMEPRIPIDTVPPDPKTQYSGMFPGGDPFDHPLRRKSSTGSSELAATLDPLEKLRDLSLLFSQQEADMVGRNSRANGVIGQPHLGGISTPATTVDSYSLSDGCKDGVNTQTKVRKAVVLDLPNRGIGIAPMDLYRPPSSTGLPGVYKYVSVSQFSGKPTLYLLSSMSGNRIALSTCTHSIF